MNGNQVDIRVKKNLKLLSCLGENLIFADVYSLKIAANTECQSLV
jgi:hypothetical protein